MRGGKGIAIRDLEPTKSCTEEIHLAHSLPETKTSLPLRHRNLIIEIPLEFIVEHFWVTLSLKVEPCLLVPNQNFLEPICRSCFSQ